MPLQATSGAASYDAYGGGVAVVPTYIEDVFSTWLYTGTGAALTITNGIDLSTKGGLVWVKSRSGASSSSNHILQDTVRGANKQLRSNTTGAEGSDAVNWAFNSSGFSMNTSISFLNDSSTNYVSWTFRKQEKMFDIQTWTGSGANRTISHALGSVPGCIIVKRTDTTGAWQVYHRSLANTEYLVLNTTAAKATGATRWNSTTPTSTVFSLGTDATVNDSGGTYVAYLFAHDAAGFGLTGTDNVISCGSFSTNSSGIATVTLGYEPQFLLIKRSDAAEDWEIFDVMRGLALNYLAYLEPNASNAEGSSTTSQGVFPTATGFQVNGLFFSASASYVYIAIRRGPMKVPTTGTSVFYPLARTGTNATATITGVGFPPDLVIGKVRDATYRPGFMDRLRGNGVALQSSGAYAETATTVAVTAFGQDGVSVGADYDIAFINYLTNLYASWFFRRAPSFFDEVCYTGTGANQTVAHNLGVVPELIIAKDRTSAYGWPVSFGFTSTNQGYAFLNTTAAGGNDTYANVGLMTAQPTSSNMYLVSSATMNGSGDKYVAYLFATCAGVSKVGSYTGTATTKQIDCGFTAGARFVLIKRTDSTGDWYVWDTARGIVSGNDSYLLLNSTAAEVTSTDYIDTYSAGFEISSTAPAAINASGGTFIFLAIA